MAACTKVAAFGAILRVLQVAFHTSSWEWTGVMWAVAIASMAIGVVLGLLYLFPIIGSVLNAHWQRHLQQVGPMSAGLAIQAATNLHGLPIRPWAGLGVLAGWATAALLTGGLLLRLRDA
jgi:ABC-2 type transport system permease protein